MKMNGSGIKPLPFFVERLFAKDAKDTRKKILVLQYLT